VEKNLLLIRSKRPVFMDKPAVEKDKPAVENEARNKSDH
jgi:hypothetical protein